MARAVAAARQAFDEGPWPRLTHEQRAEYLRAIADRAAEAGRGHRPDLAPRVRRAPLRRQGRPSPAPSATFDYYAGLADTFPFEEEAQPSMGGKFGLLVREPVGVVGAIIPWNAPLGLITYKIAPALLAGCTVILKSSPEAPGEAYVVAEIAEAVGLPPGVLNVVTADREVSELLVRDPRVDKITFTGSTAAGRRIASHVRRADRPLHPRARRQVGRRHPRRHGPGHGRRHAGPRRVHPHRPGLLVADPDRRHPEPPRRARRRPGRHLLPGAGGRPVRRPDPDGPPGRRAAA